MENSKLNAENLKESLWETLKNVKEGKIEASQADSVATQAREILRTTNTQLKIVRQAKRDVPAEVISFAENSRD